MTDEIINDDEFLESTFQSLDEDGAPLSPEVIASAMAVAGDVFSQSTGSVSEAAVAGGASGRARRLADDSQSKNKGREPMFAFAKPVAVLAASAAVFLVTWFSSPATVTADLTFGDVLDELQDAKGLTLQITRAGKESEVLVAGNSVRWQDSHQQYRIASGSRLWKINEATNTVSDTENPWAAVDSQQIDLVSLIGGRTSRDLRSVKAEQQLEHAGVLCNVFLFRPSRGNSDLIIRAYAHAKSNQLYSIACWNPGVDPATAAPLAELRLMKRNVDFDESLFVVGESLSEDGRIGKITETQGMVLLRPQTHRRWTPVSGAMIVQPGDWVRTDVRGANAASVILQSGYRLIVGPGTLLEISETDDVLLHRGEVNVSGSGNAKADLKLNGPNKQASSVSASGRFHFQITQNEELVKQDVKPLWLAGFEGSTTNESIGSLITKVDGRDVPLTVGYHKVNVEIRDQIARTTIEESFVNHTISRLEGVFYFPLPQDASISGFGMWINGELIEADVVEKQRAREIYEEILRQKKDPGLLEWAGGNIFKARVFPIEARSEKRIKIVYTQALPMRANKYRYSYGLRSEMLQKTPLRELSLNVTVNSALSLKSVTCATHSVRSDIATHAAMLEFNAQEYTPTRDFEVVCEVDAQESDVVVVPHQRGDDGYFLAQVTPPSPEGNWQREILPDGAPLNLLLVCDTSGSMDSSKREQQQQFVASVLASLGDTDRFDIACCDVDTAWLNASLVSASEAKAEAAIQWLTQRRSLGWTDLDAMAQSVIERISSQDAHTHVIYIGDGITTAGDADPQEFANRIRRIAKDLDGGTFHAVSVGSSFESGVLQAIAATGGGSVRKIDGEVTPQRTSHELLNEIAQPGLTDIKVEFRGIDVAAVYPGELPNLAMGTQQIIVGRYLPREAEQQTGEIVITGLRNGEPVRYASRITLQEAEKGNSFVPRLWARSHLDHLMAQGSTQFIKDEIISLSEEFHIMTPYTSLLVLESDEQREEFGVKRRFLMRDGEKFFADGRSNANFELLQQQMKAAGNWRLGLRQDVLRSLMGLGREPGLFVDHQELHQYGFGNSSGVMFTSTGGTTSWGYAGGGGIGGGGSFMSNGFSTTIAGAVSRPRAMDKISGLRSSLSLNVFEEDESRFDFVSKAGDVLAMDGFEDGESELRLGTLNERFDRRSSFASKRQREIFPVSSRQRMSWGGKSQMLLGRNRSSFRSSLEEPMMKQISGGISGSYFDYHNHNPQQYISWVNELFPALAAAPGPIVDRVSKWPQAAQQLAEALTQPIQLPEGAGLQIRSTSKSYNAGWDLQSAGSSSNVLYSPQRWVSVPTSVTSNDLINWCVENRRGVMSQAYRLGRTRAATPRDLSSFHPGQRPHATSPVSVTYSEWTPEIGEDEDGHVLLTMTSPAEQNPQVLKLTIDKNRNVVLKAESLVGDTLTFTNVYSDYIQVAGCWWPQTSETQDNKGRTTSRGTQQIQQLDADEFAVGYAAARLPAEKAQLLSFPMRTIKEARVADAAATADFNDYLILLLDASQIQDWPAAIGFLEKLEAAAIGESGLPWIRQRVLSAARKNEDARQQLLQAAKSLVDEPRVSELFLAGQVSSQASHIVDQNELLELLDVIKPVFDRQPEFAQALRQWKQQRVNALIQLQRADDWMPLYREIATSAPWDYNLQTSYARQLASVGEYETAFAWLKQELGRDVERQPYEMQTVRASYADLLQQNNALDQLILFLADWVAEEPTERNPYDRYLGALVSDNRMDEADDLVAKWLKDYQQPNKLQDHEVWKLQSAVQYAIGNRYQNRGNWMNPKWRQPLQGLAIYLMSHEHHSGLVSQFLGHHLYQGTKEAKIARAEAARLLKANVGTYAADRISLLLNWTINHPDLTIPDWKAIAKTLRSRWDATETQQARTAVANNLLRVYLKISPNDLRLSFMRDRVAHAETLDDPAFASQLRKTLFGALLGQEWTAEHEAEVFQLLPFLHTRAGNGHHFIPVLALLHQAVDAMLKQRIAADNEQLQVDGHPENLTRRELAEKKSGFQTAARKGLIERLVNEQNRLGADVPQDEIGAIYKLLQRWMKIEQMHFEVLTADASAENIFAKDGAFGRVAGECQSIIGDTPVAMPVRPENEDELEAFRLQLLESIRRERAFTMLSHLALRRAAPEKLLATVMAFVDQGVAFDGDEAMAWKDQRLLLLIALDRPEQLEQDLRRWIREEEYTADKQRMLARILAEQGKVTDAITLMEAVGRDVPLSGDDYSALADWYMVVDRKDDYRLARVKVFKQIEEWQINQWISQKRNQWDNNSQTELDEQVLFAFQALFEKSSAPGNYVYTLRMFYTASRDFRLLKMVPDSVVGRTPQQVYTYVSQLHRQLLDEVRHEATADQMLKRLQEVRNDVSTTTDLRACDLLEAMIERRSSEVLNEPGPHVKAAVAALRRAFNREWASGEIVQMAAFLDQMGTVKQQELNDERLRQLRSLLAMTQAGTVENVEIAWSLAHALYHSHNAMTEGIAVIELALQQFRNVRPGALPIRLNTQFGGYISLLQGQRRYAQAETVLLSESKYPANASQREWLKLRLNECYMEAYRNGGRVAFGSGEDLYRNLLQYLLQESELSRGDYHSKTMLDILTLFGNKQRRGPDYKADVKKYAFEQFPQLLRPQDKDYRNQVSRTADAVRKLIGDRSGLEFLIGRVENYPLRFENTWENAWQQFGNRLAQWRETSGGLKELEPRLLDIALRQLRRSLISSNYRNRTMMQKHHSYFWAAKEADFAKVANSVAQEHSDSGQIVSWVAEYLFNHLEHYDRAIEIMLDAHERDVLVESQQIQLVDLLQRRKRWGESISVLRPIVKKTPARMDIRVRLLKAYNGAERKQKRDEFLVETEAYFRDNNIWIESNMAQLASCMVEIQRHKSAVKYYAELIPLHQRSAPNQGIGNGTLSAYYQTLSRAHVHLGNTIEAVDAAASGIVAWGKRHEQRKTATYAMKSAIISSKNRDKFIAHLDKQAQETGSDSALIRKVLGMVLGEIEQHDKAVKQLKIAIELQPTDVETHEALTKSYAALKQPDAAVAQMLTQLDFDRHNLDLYKQVADRLSENKELSERAATSLVEAAPLEAEHHQALAEFREKQDRWGDAIAHWQHVAELRSLEPTGLLQLAAAQIHEKRWDAAKVTVQKLNQKQWPERFRKVEDEIRKLQALLP